MTIVSLLKTFFWQVFFEERMVHLHSHHCVYTFTNSLARSGGGASWLQAWNSRLGHGFKHTLPETNIHIPFSKALLKMIFHILTWDMLVPWRVFFGLFIPKTASNEAIFDWYLTLKKSNEDIPRVKSKEGQHMKRIILGSEFVIICQMLHVGNIYLNFSWNWPFFTSGR